MTSEELIQQLKSVFRNALDNPAIEITETTTAKDIKEWDSLNHIHLVLAIEKHFKLKFNSREIQSWKSVGDIIKGIQAKAPVQ
jgi:acyl carrier protein